VLSFEPSGALWEASLVMRDKETDSWWSIITGDAVGGNLEGEKLDELPVSEKVRWGEWKKRHPDTLVLSVDGQEYDPRNPYTGYFNSERTFQRITAADPRLPAKELVFAFRLGGEQYAVPHAAVEGGAGAVIGGREVFLYRVAGADVLESTRAYVMEAGDTRIRYKDGAWIDAKTGAEFSPQTGFAADAKGVEKLTGFDTFWYNLANIISDPVILEKGGPDATSLDRRPQSE
jgi:hypothetical protein